MFDFLQSYSHPSFYSYNDNLSINGTFNCNCSTQGGSCATVCACVFVYLQCPHFTRQLPGVLGFLTARFLLINWIFQLISDYWKLKMEKKTKQNKSDSLATTQVVAANSLPIYGAVVRAAVEVEVERSQQSEWSDHMAPQTNFKANLLPFASCVLLSNCSICAAWLLLCWHIKAIV